MRRWSETYAESEVRFACVCVDGRPEDVCAEFQDLYFKDSSVFNAFIREQQDFPTFPSQLGCQGFVVVDARGSFATLRSPSLNRVGKAAFEYVERVLDQLLAAPEPAGAPDAKDDEAPGDGPTKAKFVDNPCSEEPQALDGRPGTIEAKVSKWQKSFDLPSVGHEAMDADHQELVNLMKKAALSFRAEDVDALRKCFEDHAKEEEDLMRRSGFGQAGGGGTMFSALESHASDHAAIVQAANDVVAMANDGGLVPEAEVWTLCRRIVEHAVAFDSRYEGQLVEAKKRKAAGADDKTCPRCQCQG